MGRTSFATALVAAFAVHPALAHPGHGLPGWSHHGEILAFAVVMALGAIVAVRPARAARRRAETR